MRTRVGRETQMHVRPPTPPLPFPTVTNGMVTAGASVPSNSVECASLCVNGCKNNHSDRSCVQQKHCGYCSDNSQCIEATTSGYSCHNCNYFSYGDCEGTHYSSQECPLGVSRAVVLQLPATETAPTALHASMIRSDARSALARPQDVRVTHPMLQSARV